MRRIVREYNDDGSFTPEPDEIFEGAGEHTHSHLTSYFGERGDAIQTRVTGCIRDAEALLDTEHCEAAVVRAFTAAELMVSHFIVRPLVSSVILSNEFFRVLIEAAFKDSNERERKLVPSILDRWSIEIGSIRLSDGTPAWGILTEKVRPLRNAIIHDGSSANRREAALSIEVAIAPEEQVVRVIGKRLGFFQKSNRWRDSSFQEYQSKELDSWR